jgi:hypothetical protein
MKRAMTDKHRVGFADKGSIANSTAIKKPRLGGVFMIDGID